MAVDERFGQGGLNPEIDPDELVESIGLDASEIAWRKDHLDFDEADEQRLVDLSDAFRAHQDEAADHFYGKLTEYNRTLDVFGRSDREIEELKETQRAYLVTLARGEYDRDYFKTRARIGKLHDLIDMPLHYYIGQYGAYYTVLLDVVGERIRSGVVGTVEEWIDAETGRSEGADDRGLVDRIANVVGEDSSNGRKAGPSDGSSSGGPPSLAEAVEAEVQEGVRDLLSVLRILNLDMQVVVDTYIDSYHGELEEEIAERKRLEATVERDVWEPLQELDGSSQDIAASVQEISALADRNSEDMRAIATEATNLDAETQEIENACVNVNERIEDANRAANRGKRSVETAARSMEAVQDAAGTAGTDVERLDGTLQTVDSLLAVVDDIEAKTTDLERRVNADPDADSGSETADRNPPPSVTAFVEEVGSSLDELRSGMRAVRRDGERTVEGVGRTIERIEDGADHVDEALAAVEEVVDRVRDSTRGSERVLEATAAQIESIDRMESIVEEAVERGEKIATETEGIATATAEQQSRATEIAENVMRLQADDAGPSTAGDAER